MNEAGLRHFCVIFGCLLVFMLSAFFDILNDYAGVTACTVLLMAAFYDTGESSIGPILLFSGVTLYTLPIISLYFVGLEVVQTAWFALFILVGMVWSLTDQTLRQERAAGGASAVTGPMLSALGESRGNLFFIFIYLVVGLALWRGEGIGQVSFYAGWSMALLHLERIHASTPAFVPRMLGVILFWVILGLFMVFLWSGFGRIIFISFFLAPLFVTVRYHTFRLNLLLFTAIAATLPFIGRVLRFGWSDGIAGIAVDSGASHLTETSYLWLTHDTVLNPGSILEQWVLLFLGWVPRDLWTSKPIGIGSSFVDMYLGRQGSSLEHSTATGLFGEHLFYLPYAWPVSVAALVVLIVAMRRIITRLSGLYTAPVMAFDVWLITLIWGGMASFGARMWLAMFPMLAYVALLRRLDRHRATSATAHAMESAGATS